ncbi:MAG: lactate racemase domain-containing protein [Pirellulales bacterium]
MTSNSALSVSLKFGSSVWNLHADGATCINSQLPPLENLHEAVDAALSKPLDFASIDKMIVAGDTVALAVDPALPSLTKVVGSIAQWLVEHGTTPESLQVILPGSQQQVESLSEQLKLSGLSAVAVVRHDVDDSNCVSYVAADEDAQPIYLNRALVDADVVIPISCARSSGAIDYLGAFSIFPLFSNRDIRGQLYCYARLSNEAQHQHLIDRSNQAAWWLGVMVAIQVLPTENDQVAGVVCGLLDTVDNSGQSSLDALIRETAESELVIACVDSPEQTWADLAKALHIAVRYCSSGGSIVLCTQLNESLGPALKRLRDGQSSREQIERRVSKDNTDDALAAGAILEATRDRHVYLVSNHRAATVESLGMGVLADEHELAHLVKQHSRYLVIQSAQHA